MKQKNDRQTGGILSELIGERTSAKTAGLTYTASAIALFLVSFVVGMLPRGESETPMWLLYVNFLGAPIAFALTAIWYFHYTKTPLKTVIREQKCHIKYYAVALALQLVLFSLSEVNGLVLKALKGLGYQETPIELPSLDGFGFVGVLFTVAVIPAIMEELIFRGLFLRETHELSTAARVLLCGGLFALYHQNPAQTAYQFLCGAAFAFVAIRSGSFLPTVLSHLINNAVIIILYKCEIYTFPIPVYVIILCAAVICAIGLVVYFLRFDRPKPKEKTPRKGVMKELFACASVGIALLALSWIAAFSAGFSGG